MSLSSKPTSLQAYSLALFRSALHPEFFQIEGRRRIAHGDYEFEGWVTRGGHVARFEHHGLCICEVVAEDHEHLPERGHVITLPCAGEKDHEEGFSDRLGYVTSMQTETLTGHLSVSYTHLRAHET